MLTAIFTFTNDFDGATVTLYSQTEGPIDTGFVVIYDAYAPEITTVEKIEYKFDSIHHALAKYNELVEEQMESSLEELI